MSSSDALIQEFYARETTNPVYVTVDTTFQDETASIRAFVSTTLSLGERQLAAQFHEIQLDLRMVEAERVGCMSLPRFPKFFVGRASYFTPILWQLMF